MKRLLFLLLVSTTALCAFALAQDNFYYEYSTPIELTVSSDYVMVRPDTLAYGQLPGIVAQIAAIDLEFQSINVADDFVIFRIRAGYSSQEAASQLRKTKGIMFANNLFVDVEKQYFYPTDRVYLHFKPNTKDYQIDSIFQAYKLSLVDSLFDDHFIRIGRLTESSPLDVVTTGNRIYESDLLLLSRASFALPYSTMSDPNDEYYQYQWYLKCGQYNCFFPDSDIDYDEARDYTITSTSLTIGILDDGFEFHPDFPGTNPISEWDYYDHDNVATPGRFESHGMATVGILSATTNNNVGIAGILPAPVSIIAQKIFADVCPPEPGICIATEDMVALALDSCRFKGAKLISNSWGRSCAQCSSSIYNEAIRRCNSAGILVLFASGNDENGAQGWVAHPARLPEVLAVGAATNWNERWWYSMYGPELDLVAPSGEMYLGAGDIWSLDRAGGTNGVNPHYVTCSPQDEDYDCTFGGTSAACPQAAGVAGWVMKRRPDLIGDTELLREIIRHSSVDQIGNDDDTPGWDQYHGWGRLNAARALLAVSRGDPDNNAIITISDAVYVTNYMFYGGPAPVPNVLTGDADGNGVITISDIVYLVNFIFYGGPPPPISFNY